MRPSNNMQATPTYPIVVMSFAAHGAPCILHQAKYTNSVSNQQPQDARRLAFSEPPRGALTPTHSGGVGDIVGCSSLSPSSSCPRNLHSAVHSALANLLPLISPVQENEARHNNALKSAGIIGAGEHNGSSSCPNRTPSDLLRSAQVAGHTTSGRQETRILRAPLGAL